MMEYTQIYGQKRVRQIIDRSLTRGREAHAYLFHGQPGVGKDGFAIEIAMRLLCQSPAPWACGQCPSCLKMKEMNHPSYHFVLPAPSRPASVSQEKYDSILRERQLARMENYYTAVDYNPELTTLPVISIEQVRELKRAVMLKTANSSYRIFHISQAHLMTMAAANSLLKLLEEPPPRTMLLLTTTSPGKILDTIKSRCQSVRFDSLSENVIQEALVSRYALPEDRAGFFARVAGGSMERALELTDEDFEEIRKDAFTFMVNSLTGRDIDILEMIENISRSKNKQRAVNILHIMQMIMRDILQIQLGFKDRAANTDKIENFEKLVKTLPGLDMERAVGFVAQAIDYIGKNVYLPLIMTNLSEEIQQCNKQES